MLVICEIVAFCKRLSSSVISFCVPVLFGYEEHDVLVKHLNQHRSKHSLSIELQKFIFIKVNRLNLSLIIEKRIRLKRYYHIKSMSNLRRTLLLTSFVIVNLFIAKFFKKDRG